MKRAVAQLVHALLTAPGLGRATHRLYDLVTRPPIDSPRIRNVADVGAKLMRGAQPASAGFDALAQRGVDTVVNLRPESDWEEPVVHGFGMKYCKIPVSVMGAPTLEQALEFLEVVADPAMGLVFVHCFHGSDRTGAMCAVYRIAADNWTADAAIAEMRRYGFHDGYQDTKLTFVRDFAAYWAGLPAADRDRIMRRDKVSRPDQSAQSGIPFPDQVPLGDPVQDANT